MCFAYTLLFVGFICRYRVIINLFPLHPKGGKIAANKQKRLFALLFRITPTAKVTLPYICYCLGVFNICHLWKRKPFAKNSLYFFSLGFSSLFNKSFLIVKFLAFSSLSNLLIFCCSRFSSRILVFYPKITFCCYHC